jgi:large subunit ribosomal protein L1
MGKMKTANVGENENKKEEKVHLSGLKGGQRVKVVEPSSAEATEGQGQQIDTKSPLSQRKIVERVRSKKYVEAKAKFDHEKAYKLSEAVKLVKSASYSKFDGTMELHVIVKKAGISVQVNLPFQAGKVKKVEIADEDTVKKLTEGKVDFDVLVATVEMMPKLVPFARLLGPKGLMPNPKNGTLVADLKKAKGYSAGSTTVKTEKDAPLVHTVIGKNSQKDEEIVDNAEAVIKALGGSKLIVRAFIKSTMSPSVKLQLN